VLKRSLDCVLSPSEALLRSPTKKLEYRMYCASKTLGTLPTCATAGWRASHREDTDHSAHTYLARLAAVPVVMVRTYSSRRSKRLSSTTVTLPGTQSRSTNAFVR